MHKLRRHALACLAAIALFTICAGGGTARAQDEGQERPAAATVRPSNRARDGADFEVGLHVLAGSSGGLRTDLPQGFEPVLRSLRASLPAMNYRLTASFVNRVRDGGKLESKGVSGTLVNVPAAANAMTFYEFSMDRVESDAGGDGQPLVRIPRLRFGLRMPVVVGMARTSDGAEMRPVIQHEPVGITTEVSLRDGTPTVVGTLTTNRPDELLVVVLTVRRAAAR